LLELSAGGLITICCA